MAGFESPPPPKPDYSFNSKQMDGLPGVADRGTMGLNLHDYRLSSPVRPVQLDPPSHDIYDPERHYQLKYKPAEIWKQSDQVHGQLSVDVGGTPLPLKDGLNIWDLRSSVMTDLDAARSSWTERANQSPPGYSSFTDRFQEKKPSVGLSWRFHF
ncbi:MAG TPA: hypothetical protein V6C97_29575 [Oculatellaceae cyanobacterium]